MALIKSNILAEIRGSINGTTFSRNRTGAYARNRTVPVNPNSDNQISARNSMTNSSQLWRTISGSVQEQWKIYADNTPVTNRLGDTIHLSGFNQFVQLNGFLAFLGLTEHTAAPLAFGTAAVFTSVTFDIDSATDELAITGTSGADIGGTANYGIWISNPIGPGVTFYKGPWHYIGTTAGASLATFTATIPFNVTLGQQFRLRLRGHDSNYRMGNEYITPLGTAA